MSEGTKWTPGKIFLLVIGILAGLGVICCGAGYFFLGDKIAGGIHLGLNTAKFGSRLQTDFGKTAVFGIEQSVDKEMILTIGVEGDLAPERVRQVQDLAWKAFAEVFGEDGYFPFKHLAVGRPMTKSAGSPGAVIGWATNIVSVEELVKRTGVAAPPMAKILPDELAGPNVKVTIETNTAPVETKDADETKVKEGGGGGGK